MNDRLTVRLDPTEARALASKAVDLGMTKADVARLALSTYLAQEKTMDKVQSSLDELESNLADRVQGIENKNKRAFKVLLRVLKAPSEAMETLDQIFD